MSFSKAFFGSIGCVFGFVAAIVLLVGSCVAGIGAGASSWADDPSKTAANTNHGGDGDEHAEVIRTKLPFAKDGPADDTAASQNSTEEYPDDCLIVIRGKQVGGRKCQADSNGRTVFYLSNDAGSVQYSPMGSSKKIWSAAWQPKGEVYVELGTLQAVGKCLKNDMATIC